MFVTITEAEFWEAMKRAKRPPEVLHYNDVVSQLVVAWKVLRDGEPTNLMVKVYTSIFGAPGKGTSRGLGRDSIRVCLVDVRRDEGAGRSAYTTRTVGWQDRLVIKVKEMFELAGELLALGDPPECPRCSSTAMALRVASRGKNAGSKFWGCANYPRCHGTRDVAKPVTETEKPHQPDRRPTGKFDWWQDE